MEFIPSNEMKCPKSFFTGWGDWGKAILNETILSTIKKVSVRVDSTLLDPAG